MYEPRTFSIKLSNSNFSQHVRIWVFISAISIFFCFFSSSSSCLRFINRYVFSAHIKSMLLAVSKLVSKVSSIQICCVIRFCYGMARQWMIYIVLCRICSWLKNCMQQHFVNGNQYYEYSCRVLCSILTSENETLFHIRFCRRTHCNKETKKIESKRAKIFTFSKICLHFNRSSLWKHFAVHFGLIVFCNKSECQLSRSPNVHRNSRNQSIYNALPFVSSDATYKWISLLLCECPMSFVVSFVDNPLCF